MRKEAQWDAEDTRFLALCEDVRENGVRIPIPITRKRDIVDYDGIERWRAARVVQCSRIPVLYVADDQAVTAILGSLFQRKSFTKSAKAYLAIPILEAALSEARRRRMACLRRGSESTQLVKNPNVSPKATEWTTEKPNTIETLAYALGLGRTTLVQAQTITKFFEIRSQKSPGAT